MCGAHLERDTADARVTVTPMTNRTAESERVPSSQAPTGVNAIPARARGRKPARRSFPLEEMRTMMLRTRLETAITGTAQRAGAYRHISGRESRE